MQTYTHLVIGAALGGAVAHIHVFQEVTPSVVVVATIVGAGLPDAATFIQMMQDIIWYKRAPFSESKNQRIWMFLKEVSHGGPWMIATLWWLTTLGRSSLTIVLGALLLGLISHVIIDAMTHCGEEFRETDVSCLWPLNPILTSKLAGEIVGVAEYRYAHGVVTRLKTFELITLVISLLVGLAGIGSIYFSNFLDSK